MSAYRAEVEACTWWDPDTGQVLSGAEVVARCTLEPEGVMVLGPDDLGYEVFNKPVADGYWSTQEYAALLDAEAARHDAITAMFDAAYEAHGKIDPEYAGF